MNNEERWYNLLRGFLDKDFAQELDVEVPEYLGTGAKNVPRYTLFSQEAIVMMQLIRELKKINKKNEKTL